MSNERLTEKSVFHLASNIDSTELRDEYLGQVCGEDSDLRGRVATLLRMQSEDPDFLEAPAGGLATEAVATPGNPHPGAMIGPYKLLEQIGEGGMGLVYMAEQQQPVRRLVALKLVKPGMDSKQVLARFEAEKQALAMMDHPNIAKIFDAGITGELKDEGGRMKAEPAGDHSSLSLHPASFASPGRPYFVMELVRGIPLNEFCDQQKLTARQRLELFIHVCQAIQHAHQKGIIHRDLKPTNVLVTMNDVLVVPKVIDFGIAKALGQSLTEHTLHTGFAQLVGTPLYMSPEQAQMNQLGVDTRSDVYSLGVMLYELLTGTTPFDKERLKSASFDELRRIIREEEPETLSARIARTRRVGQGCDSNRRPTDVGGGGPALASSLVPHYIPQSAIRNPQLPDIPQSALRIPHLAELDWIVMKSLEKDRSRRYESASALAADIQRYLSDEPVLACPPTTMYRFQKFARKHKPALVTAASLALCLLLGTTVSAWQAVRATQAEAQATANEAQAKESAAAEAQQRQRAEANEQQATAQRDEAQKQRDEVKALADKLAAKEEELQRTLYADHIYMAKEAWDNGNVARATNLLKRHVPKPGEPDRRGFEWHYLNRLSNIGPVLSLSFKTAPLQSQQQLKLSPDRTRLIRFKPAGPDTGKGRQVPTGPALEVWNLQTGQQELMAPLSPMPANLPSRGLIMPRFSPDATRMAINSSRQDNNTQTYVPGEVKVWDTQTGKEVLSIGDVVGGVVFSPDSKLLFSAMENQKVKLWDMQTGQERLTLHGQFERPHAFTFSADGKRLAAAVKKSDQTKNVGVAGEIMIWDVQTGVPVQTFIAPTAGITQLVFSPDGKLMLLVSNAEGTRVIDLWDLQSGSKLRTFQIDGDTIWAYFNDDGTRLIGGGWSQKEQDDGEGYAKMWNTQTGQEMLSFKDTDLELSPDGKRVAVRDWKNSRTKVFDAQTGQIMLSVAGAGRKLAFSPDSKRLATQAGGMRIWDLETGDEINHIKGFIGTFILAFSQDGKRLIGSNQMSVQVWDAEVEQQSVQKLTLKGVYRQSSHSFGDSPAVFSSDFTRLAGISYKTVKLFDTQSGQELRTFTGHENNVTCVALSPDCKRIAAGDGKHSPGETPNSGTVKVWDVDTGRELFTINTIHTTNHAVIHLTFSPDGKKLAGSAGDLATKVWDAQSGRELYAIGSKSDVSVGPNSFLPQNTPAFSPDGMRLATAGKIWDAETGRELVTLKHPRGGDARRCFGFSPDGKRVLGPSGVFDAESGEFLFRVPFSITGCVTYSPDGKRLVGGAKVWDAQTGQELLDLGPEPNTTTGGFTSGQVAFSPDGYRLGIVNRAFSNEVTIYDATPLPEKP